MAFRWTTTQTDSSANLGLEVNFETAGRWGIVRVYDRTQYSESYNELRKTADGPIYKFTDYFLKIWIEPMGGLQSGGMWDMPIGVWSGRRWNAVFPLINSTQSQPAGVLVKTNDDIILPNYWGSTKPTSLDGLSIEKQYRIEMSHLYHVGLLPGFWSVIFEHTVDK